LALRKRFGKSKEKKQVNDKEIEIPVFEEVDPSEEKIEESSIEKIEDEEIEKTPITEYNETLYSSDHPSKKKQKTYKRNRWESTTTIEKNVDTIDKKKPISIKTSSDSGGIENKVDRLFAKKGVKVTGGKHEKEFMVPEGYVLKVNKKTGLKYYKKK